MTGHARHIAIAGVALIALTTVSACGGGATDIATGGNAGHPSASTNSPSPSASPSPTESGSTAPTDSTGDSTGPATTPTSSPTPTADPGEKVLSALSRKGFKCWLTADAAATGTATVHTCYLEPGTGLFDDERVQVDVGDDGIDAIWVDVSVTNHPKKTQKIVRHVLQALRGRVLSGADTRTLAMAVRTDRGTPKISWGSAQVYATDDDISFTLVAPGAEQTLVPTGDTKVSVADVRRHYTARGYKCSMDKKLKRLTCIKRRLGGIFGVTARDTCMGTRGTKYAAQCKGGHRADEVTGSAAFNGWSNKLGRAVIKHLMKVSAFAMGGHPGSAPQWVASGADGDYHDADFKGMHLEVIPGLGETDGENVKSVLEVSITDAQIGG